MIQQKLIIDRISEIAMSLNQASSGKLLIIAGEQGFGKSYIIDQIIENTSQNKKINVVRGSNPTPIGNFNISQLKPYNSLTTPINNLIKGNVETDAKARFVKNTGMTILASVPIMGEVFYAVKEISKDWREYKKDSGKSSKDKEIDTKSEFIDTLVSTASQKPFVMLLDDMQWADSSSAKLLEKLLDSIHEVPVLIVVALRLQVAKQNAYPIIQLYTKLKNKNQNDIFDLNAWSTEDLEEWCNSNIAHYKNNPDFIARLEKATGGVAGVVYEYKKYFKQNPPFDINGKLNDELPEDLVPVDLYATFTTLIDQMSQAHKNIMSLASAEGVEFTAYMMSKLLGLDVVSTIKELKEISSKFPVFDSKGVEFRYGTKTTVYKFNQAFYHRYFEGLLEYEEYVSVHGLIASILKDKYNNSTDLAEKEQIAPYLAAHSFESGDTTTQEAMQKFANERAEIYGISINGNNNQKDNQLSSNEKDIDLVSGNKANGNTTFGTLDFKALKLNILENYSIGKYRAAIQIADDSYKNYSISISIGDQVLLLCMWARTLAKVGEIETAIEKLSVAEEISKGIANEVSKCYIINTKALILLEKGNYKQSLEQLKIAAEFALKLPIELRLMTMVNIGETLKAIGSTEYSKYLDIANKIKKKMLVSRVW